MGASPEEPTRRQQLHADASPFRMLPRCCHRTPLPPQEQYQPPGNDRSDAFAKRSIMSRQAQGRRRRAAAWAVRGTNSVLPVISKVCVLPQLHSALPTRFTGYPSTCVHPCKAACCFISASRNWGLRGVDAGCRSLRNVLSEQFQVEAQRVCNLAGSSSSLGPRKRRLCSWLLPPGAIFDWRPGRARRKRSAVASQPARSRSEERV
jgi:hypothetical protein